jgi:hypothetical protein
MVSEEVELLKWRVRAEHAPLQHRLASISAGRKTSAYLAKYLKRETHITKY